MTPRTMRAMVLPKFGAPLERREVPVPAIGPNDVLLRVRAAGVGLTVVIMTANPGRVTSFPRIPGHEVAGSVVEIGAEVANVKVGDRVVCHFYLSCGNCRFCRSGRETLCTAFKGFVGQASDGGYAEYMALPARNVTPIPPGVSDMDAAVATDILLLYLDGDILADCAEMYFAIHSRSSSAGPFKEEFFTIIREFWASAPSLAARYGSDVAAVQTRAVRDGDDWVISGQKMFTTMAHEAHHVFLLARSNPDAPKHKGLTMFLVPMDAPGVEVTPLYTLGAPGRTNRTFYRGVRVPDADFDLRPDRRWGRSTRRAFIFLFVVLVLVVVAQHEERAPKGTAVEPRLQPILHILRPSTDEQRARRSQHLGNRLASPALDAEEPPHVIVRTGNEPVQTHHRVP